MTVTELFPGFYISAHESRGCRPALGFFRGLLLDGGASTAHCRAFLEALPQGASVEQTVLTHAHWDHVSGTPEGAEVLCSDATAALLGSREALSEFSQNGIAAEYGGGEVPAPPKPTRTFSGSLTLDLQGETAELLELDCDHLPGCTAVVFPQHKTVFLGDALYLAIAPGGWYYTPRLLALLDRLEALDCDTYIPGHGPVWSRAAFLAYAAQLRALAKKAGATTSEMALKREYLKQGKALPTAGEWEQLLWFVRGNQQWRKMQH